MERIIRLEKTNTVKVVKDGENIKIKRIYTVEREYYNCCFQGRAEELELVLDNNKFLPIIDIKTGEETWINIDYIISIDFS